MVCKNLDMSVQIPSIALCILIFTSPLYSKPVVFDLHLENYFSRTALDTSGKKIEQKGENVNAHSVLSTYSFLNNSSYVDSNRTHRGIPNVPKKKPVLYSWWYKSIFIFKPLKLTLKWIQLLAFLNIRKQSKLY